MDAQGLFVELPHFGVASGALVGVGVRAAQRVQRFGFGAQHAQHAFGLGDAPVGGVEQALSVGHPVACVTPKAFVLPNRANATGLRAGILRGQLILSAYRLGYDGRLLAPLAQRVGQRRFRLIRLALAKRQNILEAKSERFAGHRRGGRVEESSAASCGDRSSMCKPGAISLLRPTPRARLSSVGG